MKRILALLTAFVLAVAAYAQTAEEIVAKMDEAMSQVSEENGFRMTMDMKIPILGTMSTNAWTRGDKNQDKTKKSDEKENMKMFQSATEGYDVSIAKENADSWTIKCKKNRSNTNKDDPKNMEIVVAKGTYYPMSLSAKVDMVTVTLRDLQFNVSEKDVTFNKADYPRATIIDKRK